MEEKDYYITEEGYRCFTEAYHLRRGYCCDNGCKHCPYKNADQLRSTKDNIMSKEQKILDNHKALHIGVVKPFYCLDEVHRGKKDRCKQQCEYCTGFS